MRKRELDKVLKFFYENLSEYNVSKELFSNDVSVYDVDPYDEELIKKITAVADEASKVFDMPLIISQHANKRVIIRKQTGNILGFGKFKHVS